MLLLLLSLLFCCLVELHCEEISTPFLYFKGLTLPNNSYVVITEIGGASDSSDSIQCRSELQNCCQTAGNLTGSWSYPDGSEVGNPTDIYQARTTMRADLRRRNNANTPVGIYCCRIAYNSSDPSAKETLCVGIYGSSAGRVKISNDMTLTVNSDLNGDSPQFTLTCISTGGPATTVTWTRDSTTTVTEGTETVLNNTMTALYIHILTVTGRVHGLYSCTVENSVSSYSATYTVQVAFPPTDLRYVVQGDFSSILLMWVPPSPLGYTTGYRISYNAVGGSSNSVNIGGANTSNYTLSGLEKGKDYSISIVGISDHFFSMSVAWNLITLKGTPASTSVPEVKKNDTVCSEESGDVTVVAVSVVSLLLIVTLTTLNITQCLVIIRMRRSSRYKTETYEEPISPITKTTDVTLSPNEAYALHKITTEEETYEPVN